MALTHALSTNNYGPARLIVATSAANGTHTTLASAMADAVSGDTISLRDSVTENVTLTAGVNIAAWIGGTLNTPSITGTLTMTTAGTCNISGIRLVTNSAALLAVTGNAASIVNLYNCYLNCTNNTGITYTSSSSSSRLSLYSCGGDLGTTGIALFANSSTGEFKTFYCVFTNTGASTTASTASAGITNTSYSQFANPITLSSTAASTWEYSQFSTTAQNVTAATLGGGSSSCKWCRFDSGSASAVSISSSAAIMEMCVISSSNTNAITGAGTLSYSGLSFSLSSTVNVTTQTIVPFGANVPSFSAVLSTSANNHTGNGTTYTVICDTETYDVMSNYNNGTGTFTAPYTGKYQFEFQLYLTGCTIASSCAISVATTARTYTNGLFRAAGAQDFRTHLSCIADMTAADTATFTVSAFGEAADTDDVLGNNAYSGTWVQGRYLGPK